MYGKGVSQELGRYRICFAVIWKVNLQRRQRSSANVLRDHSEKRRVEVALSKVRLGRRQQLRPTESRHGCSSLGVVVLRQIQSREPVVQRTNDFYPNTARLLGQIAAPTQPCRDWNSQSEGLVPTPRRHGCADLNFALVHLQLRKTPADMLVT